MTLKQVIGDFKNQGNGLGIFPFLAMAWAKKNVRSKGGFPSPHSIGHNFCNGGSYISNLFLLPGPLNQKFSFGTMASVSEPCRTFAGHCGNIAESISNIFAGLEYVLLTTLGVANRIQSNLIELNLWIEFD